MANINIAAQRVSRQTGVQAIYTTLSSADTYFLEASSNTEFVEIIGDASAARTITITPQQKVDGITLAPVTLTVPANQTIMWGVLDSAIYATGGRVTLSASGACKLGLFRV